MKFHEFTPETRAEIDALVHDAYTEPGGRIRSHQEAYAWFMSAFRDAIRSGREWADELWTEFAESGAGSFVKERWKRSEIFQFNHRGRRKNRTVRRGTTKVAEDGTVEHFQEPLWDWNLTDLQLAIKHGLHQIDEHRVNVTLYRDMLALIEEHGVFTFREALAAAHLTVDAFLAKRSAA